MKKLFNFCVVALIGINVLGQAQQTANVPPPTPYEIASQDGNSRIWEWTTYELAPSGQVVPQLHRYTEMATGLNFRDPTTGQWVPSQEVIDILPDGSAAATNGQHQAYFPANIYNGTIILVTRDGTQLQSQPVGLFYDDGSNTVMIAALTNSVGQLISPNQIIYTNAFTGLEADLLYTYTKAGFEQDIILDEQPSSPESYGLNPQTAQLQMLTEFFNPPQPTVTTAQLPEQAGLALNDNTLDFGTMKMVLGRAFLLGANANDPQVLVGKEWLSVGGHQFLAEVVPVAAIADQLSQLPAVQTSSISQKYPLNVVSAKRLLPVRRLAGKINSRPMRVAQAQVPTKGLLLDYQTINNSQTNITFLGDMTYYISGTVDLFGTNTFEGGAVIKYTTNGCIYQTGGNINWDASAYRPVVFTAKDDNSAGQTISGSTGSPIGYYANPEALGISSMLSTSTISCFRISSAALAININFSDSVSLYNGQLINCQAGISSGYSDLDLGNMLFANVLTNFTLGFESLDAESVTFNNSSWLIGGLAGVSASFENCIFANVANITNGSYYDTIFSGSLNGFYKSPEFGTSPITNTFYPFQTVNGGYYYLTNCVNDLFLEAGTTNIDPVVVTNLQTRTTQAPYLFNSATFTVSTNLGPYALRDTNTMPDLGYHYDPLDYIFINSCQADTNITFTPGTAAGWSTSEGIQLRDQLTVAFSGTATSPDYWVRCNNVQEEDSNGSIGAGGIASEYSEVMSNDPVVKATFTRFSMLAGYGNPLRDDSGQLYMSLNDCEFWGTGEGGYGIALNATNCLFDETYIGVTANCNACADLNLQNCTVHGAFLQTSHQSGATWQVHIQNSAFDGTDLSQMDAPSSGSNTIVFCNFNSFLASTNQLAFEGTNTIVVANGYNWQTSWFGNFYLSTNSSLIQEGSTNANLLGLYHFTTQTNQVPEGTNIVDIGYHYVATDQYGNPLDSNGDGIPDYLEDPAGNGSGNWDTTLFLNVIIAQPKNDSTIP